MKRASDLKQFQLSNIFSMDIHKTSYRFIILLIGLIPSFLSAQQLPDRSNLNELGFLWNPAMTAPWEYWEAGMVYRQQWTGFNDAPRTASLSMQYPFISKKMSLGGYFMQDRVQPLTTNNFTITYAYRLKVGRSGFNSLSIGLLAAANQTSLNAFDVVATDLTDEFIPMGEGSSIHFNGGAGILFSMYPNYNVDKLVYFGAAVHQAVPSNLLLDVDQGVSLANLQRAIHANFTFGAQLSSDEFVLEPTVWVNYASGGIINGSAGIRLEGSETFLAGLSYTTNNTVSLQIGGILKNFMKGDGDMRIGLVAAYNVGPFGQYRDVGYEFFAIYRLGI